MGRKEDLEKLVYKENSGNDIKASKLIDELVYLEEQMVELKKLPFIKVHPKNPQLQKATPAAKLYKEMLQQYNNSMRLLLRIAGDLGESEEISPLRKWVKSRGEMDAD
jgi:hypothetical protein